MTHIESHELVGFLAENRDAILIDVRFGYERAEVGYVSQSLHIPMYTPDWELNQDFVRDVSVIARPETPIVIICRTGNRSCDAVDMLEQQGFKRVYNLLQGYVGLVDQLAQHEQHNFAGILVMPSSSAEFRV